MIRDTIQQRPCSMQPLATSTNLDHCRNLLPSAEGVGKLFYMGLGATGPSPHCISESERDPRVLLGHSLDEAGWGWSTNVVNFSSSRGKINNLCKFMMPRLERRSSQQYLVSLIQKVTMEIAALVFLLFFATISPARSLPLMVPALLNAIDLGLHFPDNPSIFKGAIFSGKA